MRLVAPLDELIARLSKNAAYQVAEEYATRGERNAAFDWLEWARVQHDEGLEFVRMDSLFANLYEDARWKAFLRKVNLPVG